MPARLVLFAGAATAIDLKERSKLAISKNNVETTTKKKTEPNSNNILLLAGQVFKQCVKGCKDTCAALSLGNDGCKETCTEGCECPDGKVEDKNGNCVPVSECGCHKNGVDYNKGETVNDKDKNGNALLWLVAKIIQ